jgi:hypothetical protein
MVEPDTKRGEGRTVGEEGENGLCLMLAPISISMLQLLIVEH